MAASNSDAPSPISTESFRVATLEVATVPYRPSGCQVLAPGYSWAAGPRAARVPSPDALERRECVTDVSLSVSELSLVASAGSVSLDAGAATSHSLPGSCPSPPSLHGGTPTAAAQKSLAAMAHGYFGTLPKARVAVPGTGEPIELPRNTPRFLWAPWFRATFVRYDPSPVPGVNLDLRGPCHLKLGGCTKGTPPAAIVRMIETFTSSDGVAGVRVAGIKFCHRTGNGLARCALRDPANDLPRIVAAMHHHVWMAPEGAYRVTCVDPDPVPGDEEDSRGSHFPPESRPLRDFAEHAGRAGLKGARHLVTCAAWSPARPVKSVPACPPAY